MRYCVWAPFIYLIVLGKPVFAQDNLAVAVPISSPPVIDGVLDEPFWTRVDPVTGFLQRDPVDGCLLYTSDAADE